MATVMLMPATMVTIVINVHLSIFLNLFILVRFKCGGKVVRGRMMENGRGNELRKLVDELMFGVSPEGA